MRLSLLSTVAAVGLMVAAVPEAHAALTLQLSSGGTTVTIVDGGVGDANSAAGAVTFIGAVGNFNINVSTGESKPIIGTAAQPQLDLNSVDTTSSAGGTLTLLLSDTDFTGAGLKNFISSIGGTLGAVTPTSLAYSTYYGATNTVFDLGTALASTSFSAAGAFSQNVNSVQTTAAPYSLTEKVVIVSQTGDTTSFDAHLKVPEPATLAILGSGLVAFGFLRRRNRA